MLNSSNETEENDLHSFPIQSNMLAMAPRLAFFLPCIFLWLLAGHCSSPEMELRTGSQVMIPVPSYYQDGFLGRASLAVVKAKNKFQMFRAALSIEATQGEYSCSIVVLLGNVKAWASDHASKFHPVDSCLLELSGEGELRLADAIGTKLSLKETGNLLLLDSKGSTIWQSFAYPVDTLLWSQVLSAPSILTSFPTNSTCFYSMEIIHGRMNFYLKLGTTGLKLFGKDGHKIGQLGTVDPKPAKFVRLGADGRLSLYQYSATDGSFQAFYQAPTGFCDIPFPCGSYGICTHSNSCTCFLLSTEQYSTSPQDCYEETESDIMEMKEIDGVGTILRTEPLVPTGNRRECMMLCRDKSSCHAAMYINSTRECFHYRVAGGIRQVGQEDGVTFWVKVPRITENTGMKKVKIVLMIIATALDCLAICLIIASFLYYLQEKNANARVVST